MPPQRPDYRHGRIIGAYLQASFGGKKQRHPAVILLPDSAIVQPAYFDPRKGGENVVVALEAPSLEDVTDPVGRTFRAFADQTRSDRRALAACLRGSRRLMTSEEAAGIRVPVLIAVGTRDEIAGSAAALGKIIPGAEVLDIPNRDHMRAVGDKVYKVGVTDFLSRRQ